MKHFNPKEVQITLLTLEQAEKLPEEILSCGDCWWLRSPGYNQDDAAYVGTGGGVYESGDFVNYDHFAVRPAFEIANLNSEFGKRVYVGKLLCTVIDKDLVLADKAVCCYRFDIVSNDWETSELKAFIESDELVELYIKDDLTGVDTAIRELDTLAENEAFSKKVRDCITRAACMLSTQKDHIRELEKQQKNAGGNLNV